MQPSAASPMPVHLSHSGPAEQIPVLKLLCLPYAGGNAAVYHRWRQVLPVSIEVVPIELPESLLTRLVADASPTLPQVAAELADELASNAEQPFILLGHSLGAWLAFELARELRHRAATLPQLLIVSGSRAPHLPPSESSLHQLPDDEFVAELVRRFDGIPPAVNENEELLQMVLPALRAGIGLVEHYEYTDAPPLEIEILALGGNDDPAVSATQLHQWHRHTTAKFSARLVPGGHFFLFAGDKPQPPGGPSGAAARISPALRIIATKLQQVLSAT